MDPGAVLRKWPQCAVDGEWPKIGTTDTDVYDVGKWFAGGTAGRSVVHRLCKRANALQNRPDVWHHVATVDLDGTRRLIAQGNMQYRTVLGDIDAPAIKHRPDLFCDARVRRQRQQQLQCLVRDWIL